MAQGTPDSLSVPLDPTLFAFVCDQASIAGFSTPAEYVNHLIQAARRTLAERQLEGALLQGLDSGDAGVMEAQGWEEMRERVRRNYGA